MRMAEHYIPVAVLLAAATCNGVIGACAAAPLPNPTVTTVWNFLGANSSPNSFTIYNGARYGTTANGGPFDIGTIFELKPAGSRGWKRTVLYSFKGGADGSVPLGVVFAAGGKMYGSTLTGGYNNNGTVFELSPPAVSGHAWKHTALHEFTGKRDGATPNPVTIQNGSLYGTTLSVESCRSCTAVFQLSPPAVEGHPWKETVLYTFSDATPMANLVSDANGALYGTREYGAFGAIFQLTPPAVAGGAWTESVLHQFTGGADGEFPQSLAWGPDGALYGATFEGGSADCESAGCGTIYRLAPPAEAGGAWTESILYSFTGTDGAIPNSPLVFDGNGAIYGTTRTGYPSGNGTVFQLEPPAASGDPWTLNTLYDFTGGTFGYAPASAVLDGGVLDVGVTNDGYSWLRPSLYVQDAGENGAMVQIAPPAVAGGSWTASLMYGFGEGSDGSQPVGNLIANGAGNLYGTAHSGGAGLCSPPITSGCGVVFELSPPAHTGDPWMESILYSFQGGNDGVGPNEAILDSNGVLFGTTLSGGTTEFGTVFELKPPATQGGVWAESVLYSFGERSGDGEFPTRAMAVDGNGALYYATASGGSLSGGAIYQLTPPAVPGGAWTNAAIYNFPKGASVGGTVSLSFSNGALYGATYGDKLNGRRRSFGSVFQLSPPAAGGQEWAYNAYVFPGGDTGGNPVAIAIGGDGSIFGATAMTTVGDNNELATVFQLTPPVGAGGWTYANLYTFSGKTSPTALAFVGGNLVGGTQGMLFQLAPPAAPGGAWTYSTLYNFAGGSPAGLTLANGTLFGTATGGIGGNGSLFELTF
jgi:uncharacterized repeat protein (TIGR03803 family)